MRLFRLRFTMRWLMVAVAVVSLFLSGVLAVRRGALLHGPSRERRLIQIAGWALATGAVVELCRWSRSAKHHRQHTNALALAEVKRRMGEASVVEGSGDESSETDRLALLRGKLEQSANCPWLVVPDPPEPE